MDIPRKSLDMLPQKARKRRRAVHKFTPSIKYLQLEHELAVHEDKIRELRPKLRRERAKLIRQVMRYSPEVRVWRENTPPMTYRQYEQALRLERSLKLARERDSWRLDPTPLPGDIYRNGKKPGQ